MKGEKEGFGENEVISRSLGRNAAKFLLPTHNSGPVEQGGVCAATTLIGYSSNKKKTLEGVGRASYVLGYWSNGREIRNTNGMEEGLTEFLVWRGTGGRVPGLGRSFSYSRDRAPLERIES